MSRGHDAKRTAAVSDSLAPIETILILVYLCVNFSPFCVNFSPFCVNFSPFCVNFSPFLCKIQSIFVQNSVHFCAKFSLIFLCEFQSFFVWI